MWEVPKYIRGRLCFSVEELELLIKFICVDSNSIKMADRFIQTRLNQYEIGYSANKLTDSELEDWKDWKMIETYFEMHKLSFERQYFKKYVGSI